MSGGCIESLPHRDGVTRRHALRRVGALAGAATVLAACGGDPYEDLPRVGETTGKLVYSTWGAPERRERENVSLLVFFKNFDVNVDVVWASTFADYLQKVHGLLASGTPPDVLRLSSWAAQTFFAEGAVRKLDPYIKRDRFRPDALMAPFDVATYKRSWYGLPRAETGLYVVFYNRTLFSQAGLRPPRDNWSMDDLLHAARAITSPSSDGRQRWGIVLDGITDSYHAWLWSNGASAADPADPKALLEHPAAAESLQWLADLRHRHRVAPRAGELSSSGVAAFLTGRVGMWYANNNAELDIRQAQSGGTAPNFEWAMATQPRGKSGQFGLFKPDVASISSASQAPDDGWELLQYFVDPETQQAEWELGLWAPQAKRLLSAESYVKPAQPPHDRRPAVPGLLLKPRTPVHVPRGDEMRAITLRELAGLWDGTRPAKEATVGAIRGVNAILEGG